MKIIAFDEEDETLAGVKEGTIFARPLCSSLTNSVIVRSRCSRWRLPAIVGDSAEQTDFVPTLAIKKDEIEAFTKKINQLRGR